MSPWKRRRHPVLGGRHLQQPVPAVGPHRLDHAGAGDPAAPVRLRSGDLDLRTHDPRSDVNQVLTRLQKLRPGVRFDSSTALSADVQDQIASFRLINNILKMSAARRGDHDLHHHLRRSRQQTPPDRDRARDRDQICRDRHQLRPEGVGLCNRRMMIGALLFKFLVIPLVDQRPFHFPNGPVKLAVSQHETRQDIAFLIVALLAAITPALQSVRLESSTPSGASDGKKRSKHATRPPIRSEISIFVIWGAFWIYWLLSATNTREHPARGLATPRRQPGHHRGGRPGIRRVHGSSSLAIPAGCSRRSARSCSCPGLRSRCGRESTSAATRRADDAEGRARARHLRPVPLCPSSDLHGILIGLLGTALAINLYYLIALAVLTGYFVFSATVEERNMTVAFPEQYPEYKSHTNADPVRALTRAPIRARARGRALAQ